MSIQAVGWVLEQPIPAAQKLVLVSIANHADRQGSNAYPGQDTIAVETSMSTRTIRRHLKWLETHEWIVRYRRGRVGVGAGRDSDGYEIPGVRGETAKQCRQRLGRHEGEAANLTGSPSDDDEGSTGQPDRLMPVENGAEGTDGEGSTGQIVQVKRPNRAGEADTGVQGTVLNRPEPTTEEEGRDVFDLVVHALDAADRARLDADPSLDLVVPAFGQLLRHGWPADAAASALVANPLVDRRGRPVDSVARVLVHRARQLAKRDPPEPASRAPVDDCPKCSGSGWIPADDGVEACPCRSAA